MNPLFQQINEWIVAGKLAEAKRALGDFDHSKITRVEAATELASLYRRVDWNAQGVKVLSPFVLGRGRLLPQSNVMAKIEYADCLKNLGLLNEARKILLSEEVQKIPHARFILGLSYLHDYELEKAEEQLFELHSNPSPEFSHYQQQIISVNLLMAMLREVDTPSRQKIFQKIYTDTFQKCSTHSYQLLLNHLWVIQLQFKVLSETVKKDDGQETDRLEYLPNFSRKTAELYLLLKQILLKEISSRQFAQLMERLRKESADLSLHEVVREIDFQSARALEREAELQKVFDQTVYPSYRKKIIQHSGKIVPNASTRILGDSKSAFEFNLDDLKSEPLLVQTILLLVQEQYFPLSTHYLWNSLMSSRHFIEPSSRQSIHQLIKRLRNYFSSRKIPLMIEFEKTGYRLKAVVGKSAKIHWPSSWQENVKEQSLQYLNFMDALKTHFDSAPIRLSEIMKLMPGTSRRTIQFFMVKAVQDQRLVKHGKNKGAYYSWLSTLPAK